MAPSSGRRRLLLVAIAIAGLGVTLAAYWLTTGEPTVVEVYSPRQPGTLTFCKDIAPLVLQHCAVCHRRGESAPFCLITYDDIKSHASQIVTVTGSRFMPPWLPESQPHEFVGQRTLTVDQIGSLRQWVDEGAAEGDPSDLPSLPEWADGWQLGEPDLVVTAPKPFILPADGTDVYRNLVIPLPVDRTRYVRAIEFRPGNAPVVHHARMAIDRTSVSRHLDQQDPEPGFDGMLLGEAKSPDGHFLGWTPGKIPTPIPDGMAWRLEEDTDMVVQLHLLPTGKPELVQPTIGLFFTDEPPKKTPLMLRLGSKVLDIPAGKNDYTIKDAYRLPVDVYLMRVYPHAHYLCKEMIARAELPDGTTRRIIHIRDWDFNWQDDYVFTEPLLLPKDTVLEMTYIYDNSADNIRNPHDPPKHILYGPQSYDEMGDLWLQVLPRRSHYMMTLRRDFARQDIAARVDGYRFRLEHHPDDYILHNSLGTRLLSLGKKDEAVAEFREAVRLNPEYAKAHNNLGYILLGRGKVSGAIRHLNKAVQIEPDNYKAHNNLANALLERRRFGEAIKHYRRAVQLNPDYAKAHQNLAVVLRLLGRNEEAETHARLAQEHKP